MDVESGKTVELDRVLLLGDENNITAGEPVVDGAKVLATSQGDGKKKKIIVFKYKSKVRYRKKTGHRQHYTRLTIDQIVKPGETAAAPAKQTRQRKQEETSDGA